jgi:hypothetical protein
VSHGCSRTVAIGTTRTSESSLAVGSRASNRFCKAFGRDAVLRKRGSRHCVGRTPELETCWDRIKADPAALAAWLTPLLMLITVLLGSADRTTINNSVQQTTNVVIEQCVQHPQPLRATGH